MRVTLFLLLMSLSALSHSDVDVSFDAWARATAPGATTGAVYGTLTNHGDSVLELTDVMFDAAGHAMVHRTVERDGMMRMMHADIQLAPGDSVTLEPGGLHMMLMRLEAPLQQGCQYEVILGWSNEASTSHVFTTGSFGQSKKPELVGQTCP